MHWCLIRDRSRFRPATVVVGWGDDMSRFARGSFSLVRGRLRLECWLQPHWKRGGPRRYGVAIVAILSFRFHSLCREADGRHHISPTGGFVCSVGAMKHAFGVKGIGPRPT